MLININELKRSAVAGFEYSNFCVKKLGLIPGFVYLFGGAGTRLYSSGLRTSLYPSGGLGPAYPPQLSEIFCIGCSTVVESSL